MAFTLEDKGFQAAIRAYCNLRKNIDPAKELRRRAKNIGLRLIRVYKAKGVDLLAINRAVEVLGYSLKIRPKIRNKRKTDPGRWSFPKMAKAELNARRSAKGFTATGWFPPVEKLGGNPRDTQNRTGPKRGKLEEVKGKSETLVNQQPGAGHVMDKAKTDCQNAVSEETADMTEYIARRQNEVARRNGL